MLVFTIVFEIHCNLFIVLPIRLKIYRSIDFFFFAKKVCMACLNPGLFIRLYLPICRLYLYFVKDDMILQKLLPQLL